jgi:hypothetical protein
MLTGFLAIYWRKSRSNVEEVNVWAPKKSRFFFNSNRKFFKDPKSDALHLYILTFIHIIICIYHLY